MFFFQHPLAEMVVPHDDLAYVEMLWRDWSPGYDAAADLPHVRAALGDQANLTAALGYYRSTFGDGPTREEFASAQEAAAMVPDQPLLYLHGADDGCIGADVAASARGMLGDDGEVEIIPGVGHFLHLETPGAINDRLLEFLT